MGYWSNVWDAVKAVRPRRPSAGGVTTRISGMGLPFIPPASQFDYFREAGDIQRNSVFGVCRDFMARQFLQPDWAVGYLSEDDEWEAEPNHELVKVLENTQASPDPRRKTTCRTIYTGAIGDYLAYGNAYFVILFGAGGAPVGLEWIPARQIQVESDGNGISVYRRWVPRGVEEQYAPEDIVHVIHTPDPDEPLIGIGPLQLQIRNLAAMNVGERTNGALLRNGTMGKLITPKISVEAINRGEKPDQSALTALESAIKKRARGEAVGSHMSTTLPVDLVDLGASPEDLAIITLLDRPEAMIVAACGLNSMALDLPSSRDTRTYANKAEARREAMENGVAPCRDAFADAFTSQLAILFDQSGELRVWSDYDDVPAMRENTTDRVNQASTYFTSTLGNRNDARKVGGFPPLPEGDPEGEKWYGEMSEEQKADVESQREHEMAMNGQEEEPIGFGD